MAARSESRLATDLARCVDPVALATAIGMEPDAWQVDVLRSDHPRVLLNCARQTGKSVVVAVKAVHVAVYEPGSLVLCLSPSQRQSGELFKKVLATYRSLGRPVPSDAESATTLVLENGSRVVALPGAEQTVRSYSAVRLLLVDEAARVDDETIAATRPMLAVSGGQLIALSTPAGRRGWWHGAFEDGGAAWSRVRVTAADCPRISAAFLAEEKASMGDYFYRQEYCCEFAESDAQLISEATLKRMWDPRSAPPLFPEGHVIA